MYLHGLKKCDTAKTSIILHRLQDKNNKPYKCSIFVVSTSTVLLFAKSLRPTEKYVLPVAVNYSRYRCQLNCRLNCYCIMC